MSESSQKLIYPVYMIFVRTILSRCCVRARPSPTIPGLSTSSAILSSLHKKLSLSRSPITARDAHSIPALSLSRRQ